MSVKQMGKDLATSGDNPAVLAKSWTKNLHDGFTYTYDEEGSRKAVDAEGNPLADAVVMKVWTREETPEGTTKLNPITGEPILNSLAGDFHLAQYNTKADFLTKYTESMNSDLAVARIIKERSAAEAKKVTDDLWAKKTKMQELKGRQGIAKTQEAGVEARKTKAAPSAGGVGDKPASTVQGVFGKVEQTKEESINTRAELKLVAAKYNTVTTDDEAYRVGQVRNDPDASAAVAIAIKKVLEKEMTPEEYIDKMLNKIKVPREFAEDLLKEAETLRDEFIEADEKSRPGILRQTWDKIFK
jgi:exoribonuclease R